MAGSEKLCSEPLLNIACGRRIVKLLIHYTFFMKICYFRSLKSMFLIKFKPFKLFKHFRKYIFNNVLTNQSVMNFFFMFPFSALLLVLLLRFRQFVL
jgi:hypothetical protein